MIIKPVIKNNICARVHPIGCKENVERQIKYVKNQGEFKGPKNVLIIGGSSGYGLASRISLAYGCGSNTVNVSYENAPRGRKTGSAGWWNNIFFQKFAQDEGLEYKDFIGDAFSNEMKKDVVDYIKENIGKVDLLIYSLASNKRTDPVTGITYNSTLKSVGNVVEGYTVDINNLSLKKLVMEEANDEEIEGTIKVMGGEDWKMWVDSLIDNDLASDGFKTIAYTYLGSDITSKIYSGGTIGQAKKHLEITANEMDKEIKEKFKGEALISSSKAIVTKASIYIPMIPVYGSALYKVMKEKGTHEDEIQQKYRLLKDMVYGEKRIVDEQGRLRPDNLELDSEIQEKVVKIMEDVNDDNFLETTDVKGFIDDFMKINGFNFDTVDYDADVDIEELSKIELI